MDNITERFLSLFFSWRKQCSMH